MKVLIACEESQTVCKAFREKGMRLILVTYKSAQEVILNGISRTMF